MADRATRKKDTVNAAGQWINDVQGLDGLPDLSVVLGTPSDPDSRPMVYEKNGDSWNVPGVEEDFASREIRLPARILYLP
jgi:hypothetical protein